jgi:ATP-dependent DNA helicase PIF1
MQDSKLTEEQQRILQQVINGQSLLITGPAGVGKSHLCKHICLELNNIDKIYRIIAPTGVAAVNIGGQTIHRFLGIRPDIRTLSDYVQRCKRKSQVPWDTLDVIMIDEVSMVHPDLFCLIDSIARLHKQKNLPFGGIQMIFVGDFFQLPPIKQKTESRDTLDYIFETELWKELNPHIAILKQVMRQYDLDFVEALNDLRIGEISPKLIHMVQKCTTNTMQEGKHYVKLYALNVRKEYANETELANLKTEQKIYHANDVGNETYLKDCRAKKKIVLKLGCPVMLLWNLPQYNLCNGSVGIVQNFDINSGYPVVKFNDGPVISVTPQTWTLHENFRQGKRILASRKQIPLTLAYALSQHKSQSLTIDRLVVDCASVFTTGQAYVAISRSRNMEGLIIKNFDIKCIMVDKKVKEFYARNELSHRD